MEKLPQVYQTVVSDVLSQCYTLFAENGDSTKVLRKLKQLWLKKLLTKVDDYVDLDKFYTGTDPPKLKTKRKKSSPTVKMKKNNNIIKYSCKSMMKPCSLSMPDIGFHERTSSIFGLQNGIAELPTNGVSCHETDNVNKLENGTSLSPLGQFKIGKKRCNTTQTGLTNEKEIEGPPEDEVALPKKLKVDNRDELCDNLQKPTCGIQRKSTQKIRRKFVNPVNVKKKNFKTLDQHSLISKQKKNQKSGKSQDQNTCADSVHTLKHIDQHDNADLITVNKKDFSETIPDSVTNDKAISVSKQLQFKNSGEMYDYDTASKTNSSFKICNSSHNKRPIRLCRNRQSVAQSSSNQSSLEPVTQSDRSYGQNINTTTTNYISKPCEKTIKAGFTGEHKLSPKQVVSGDEHCDNFTITRIDMPLVPSQVSNRRQIRLTRSGVSLVKESNALDTNLHNECDKKPSNFNVVGTQLPCKAVNVMRGNMPQINKKFENTDFTGTLDTTQSCSFELENLLQPFSHSETDTQIISQNNKVKFFDTKDAPESNCASSLPVNANINLKQNQNDLNLVSNDLPVQIYRETEKYNYTYINAYAHRRNIAKRKKVKIALPARMGFTKDELTCIIKVPPWALQGSTLPKILTPVIRRIHVNNTSISEATSLLQEHINNYDPILQVDGLGVKFILKSSGRNGYTTTIRKHIKDNSVIDSEDDVTDEEDIISAFQAKNVIFCQFTSVKHYRNIWRLFLKNGIMRLNGKDYCFSTAEGIVTW